MSFHVGQKVVVVDDSDNARHYFKKGDTFTVLGLVGQLGNPRCIEVSCKPSPRGNRSWDKRRFRPVVEDRKSVSFTIGADPDSDRWDNRKKRKEKV